MGVTINNESTTAEPTATKATEGLNAFYWFQIFALDSSVIEAQDVKLTWRIPNYCNVSS